MPSVKLELERIVREVLSPLVEADSGKLYIVRVLDEEVAIHLTGRFSGCAGNELVTERILQPALDSVAPGVRIAISTGPLVPDGAILVESFR